MGFGLSPFGMFSPFGFGGYGMGMGMSPVMLMPRLITMMATAVIMVLAINALKNMFNNMGDAASGSNQQSMGGGYDYDDESMSVCRIQVGLLGMARDLQKDLDQMADKADTSTDAGLHYLLTECVLALLRNPEYWVYASSASASERSPEAAEQRFAALSMEERGKFQNETLSNVDSIKRAGGVAAETAAGVTNEYIVVTLLVACDGLLRLPKVESNADLKAALSLMGGLRQSQVAAVEVLWTPQQEGDTLTANEVMTDYPKLIPL